MVLSALQANPAKRTRAALLAGTILISGLACPAFAQTTIDPIRILPDENGVDLATGEVAAPLVSISIGEPDNGGMVYSQSWINGGPADNVGLISFIDPSGANGGVIYEGGLEKTFYGPTFPLTSANAEGETISDNGDGSFNYRLNDGTIKVIGYVSPGGYNMYVKKVTTPTGEAATYNYKTMSSAYGDQSRIQSITNNLGYQTKFGYVSNTITDVQSVFDYLTVASATLINNAVDSCDPTADACTGLTQNWPKLTFSTAGSTTSVTDSLNQISQFTWDLIRLTGIKRPSSTSNDLAFTYGADGLVSTATKGGVVSNYAWTTSTVFSVNRLTAVRSDSLGTQITTIADSSAGVLLSSTDALNRTTGFAHNGFGRLTGVTFPEGNSVQYEYDVRGNVKKSTSIAKTGSGLANIVLTADFDINCTNQVKCNQPNWTRDALNNQTDYTYNPTTGQIETVTLPAATTGGIRPQTRFSYTALNAWYKASGNSITQATAAVSKLTGVSSCRTTTSCLGSADEQKATFVYQVGSSSVASNLLPASTTLAIGNNSASLTTALGYDPVGNVITVDGPLAGNADTTALRYDALRRQVGTISPDPDGAGALPNLASRITYDPKSRATLVEQGTTQGQTDTAWAGFTPVAAISRTYNAADQELTITLQAGGTAYAKTQNSYDSRGRLDCTAVRMDPAQWAGQTDACVAQTASTNGSDRITKLGYDAANRVQTVTESFGTVGTAVAQTNTYTPNGQPETVRDGENNLTTNEYDGHDRIKKTRFPASSQGAASSSTTDFEELIYDANSRVTQRRLRDGQSIIYTLDNLGRPTLKNLPGTEADITYSYDLASRITSAVSTNTLTFNYDALGRLTSTTDNLGTIGYTYDTAGRRDTMNYPGGGLTITYDYDTLSRLKKIRENGATSGVGVLVSYTYDNLGRRDLATFGNGSVQDLTYGPDLRLQNLINDLSGTTSDLTQTFAYLPSGQIKSSLRSNDLYAWTGHVNTDRGYNRNGLNQYTSTTGTGGVSFGYDARGNLTSSGSNAYTYTSENQLNTGPGGAKITYDELGRLKKTSVGASTATVVKYQYDNSDLIAEYNNSNALLRRYVHGPGVDEPIVWYEGAGTTNRRFLMADERGSIVSVTDSAGVVITRNRYDEFGIPQSANQGIRVTVYPIS
jgi:YD repeat-containing protein